VPQGTLARTELRAAGAGIPAFFKHGRPQLAPSLAEGPGKPAGLQWPRNNPIGARVWPLDLRVHPGLPGGCIGQPPPSPRPLAAQLSTRFMPIGDGGAGSRWLRSRKTFLPTGAIDPERRAIYRRDLCPSAWSRSRAAAERGGGPAAVRGVSGDEREGQKRAQPPSDVRPGWRWEFGDSAGSSIFGSASQPCLRIAIFRRQRDHLSHFRGTGSSAYGPLRGGGQRGSGTSFNADGRPSNVTIWRPSCGAIRSISSTALALLLQRLGCPHRPASTLKPVLRRPTRSPRTAIFANL